MRKEDVGGFLSTTTPVTKVWRWEHDHFDKETTVVKITSFAYAPGDKWDCGYFNFTATTPLGQFTWKEVVPGPRHSEDYRQLDLELNGVDLSEQFAWNEGPLADLDFEAPGKPGKWADLFAKSKDDVEETFAAWFETNKNKLVELVQSK